MNSSTFFQNAKSPTEPIIVYIKGLDHFYGYRIMDGQSNTHFSTSTFKHNCAELDALISIIRELKENGSLSNSQNTLLVRTNLEWTRDIIRGVYTPKESRELHNEFKKRSTGIDIKSQWVRKNDKSTKPPDISDKIELEKSIDILIKLDRECQEEKSSSQIKIKK